MPKYIVYGPCDQTVYLLGRNGTMVFKGSEALLFDTETEARKSCEYSGEDVREIEDLEEFLKEDWTW